MTDVKLGDNVYIRPHKQIMIHNVSELDNNCILETYLELRNKKKCRAYLSGSTQNHKSQLNVYNASKTPTQGYVDWDIRFLTDKQRSDGLPDGRKDLLTGSYGNPLEIS